MKKIVVFLLTISSVYALRAQTQFGVASFYGGSFHGKPTASGDIYSQNGLTAAHKTLPLGTIVKVTNEKNKRSIFVKINDRGPYVKGRIIDMSTKAAEILGFRNKGTAYVKVEVVNPDEVPEMLVNSPDQIAAANGIPEDCKENESAEKKGSAPEKTALAADCNSKEDQTALSTGKESSPRKDAPQPITWINPSNTNAIINRSPYFVITNIDKSQTGFYAVQVGVFSDPSVIFALMDELEKFKQSLMIQQVSENGKTVYKLYMGKFQNRAYADALRTVLSDKYKDALVMQYQ